MTRAESAGQTLNIVKPVCGKNICQAVQLPSQIHFMSFGDRKEGINTTKIDFFFTKAMVNSVCRSQSERLVYRGCLLVSKSSMTTSAIGLGSMKQMRA